MQIGFTKALFTKLLFFQAAFDSIIELFALIEAAVKMTQLAVLESKIDRQKYETDCLSIQIEVKSKIITLVISQILINYLFQKR